MRALLAGLLFVGAVLFAPAPVAPAAPGCPPTCDAIPADAWPDPWLLPMNDDYHWPKPADLAVPVTAPRFRFEELCASPPVPDDPRGYAVAARAVVDPGPGQWRLDAQVVHWRGETWRGGQLAAAVFDTAVATLRDCQRSAPWLSPSITTAGPDRLAAVISGPVIARQYLLVDPRSSTITELVFSHDGGFGPPVPPWRAVPDAQVFEALSAPLCRAYLGSCG